MLFVWTSLKGRFDDIQEMQDGRYCEERVSVETLRIIFELISLTSGSFIIIVILVSIFEVVSVHVVIVLICIRFS